VYKRQHERARRQPVEQHLAIRRGQNLIESVAATLRGAAARHREQVQIVIAERHRGGGVERTDPAQHAGRFRTAIHEVAHEPQLVAVGRVIQLIQQLAEFGIAALHVADRVQRHITSP